MRLGALDDRAAEIRQAERMLLGDIREALAAAGALPARLDLARRATADLDELFLLVMIGEFNAGKSAIVNVLLGSPVLPEGVTPTTDAVTLVRYGEPRAPRQTEDRIVELWHPSELLRDVAIVDTPGTNAIVREHERLTRDLLPRSDLVLFVTSADRPLPESERRLLEELRRWEKPLVVLLNKSDLLHTPADLATQLAFVERGLRSVTVAPPPVLAVSARRARAALDETNPEARRRAWEASGFAALEAFLQETLADRARLQLKLASPLGVVARVLVEERAEIDDRRAVLQDDLRTSEDVARLLQVYADDIRREVQPRLAEIGYLVQAIEARGERFFDEAFRIQQGTALFKSEAMRQRFEREVLADAAAQIQRRVTDLVDWLIEQDARLWRTVAAELERRARVEQFRPPEMAVGFDVDRRAILQSVVRVTQDVIHEHERAEMPRELAASLRQAAERVLLIEVGAVGLGAAVVGLVSSTFLDVTGITAAAALAGLGLVILPLHKRRAIQRLREETARLKATLTSGLRDEIDRQVAASLQRIRDAIAPYDRFVRAEQLRLDEGAERLDALRERVARLRAEIEALGGQPGAGVSNGTERLASPLSQAALPTGDRAAPAAPSSEEDPSGGMVRR